MATSRGPHGSRARRELIGGRRNGSPTLDSTTGGRNPGPWLQLRCATRSGCRALSLRRLPTSALLRPGRPYRRAGSALIMNRPLVLAIPPGVSLRASATKAHTALVTVDPHRLTSSPDCPQAALRSRAESRNRARRSVWRCAVPTRFRWGAPPGLRPARIPPGS